MEFATEYTKIFATLVNQLNAAKLEFLNEKRRSNELSQALDQETSEKKKLIEEKSRRDQTLGQYLSTNEVMTKEIAELKAANSELLATNNRLKIANDVLANTNSILESDNDRLNAEITTAKDNAKELSNAVLRAHKMLDDERTVKMKYFHKHLEFETKLNQAIAEKSELNSQLEQATAEKTELIEEKTELTADKSELIAKIRRLKAIIKKVNSEKSGLRNQSDILRAEYVDLGSEFDKLNRFTINKIYELRQIQTFINGDTNVIFTDRGRFVMPKTFYAGIKVPLAEYPQRFGYVIEDSYMKPVGHV